MNNSFAGRISYVTVALLLATGFFFPLAVLAQETVNPLVEILKNAKTNMPYETKMSSCPNLYRNLSFGSRGNDVVELQNFLIAQGDLAVGNNTGYFGRMTEAAVKSWQDKKGVVSSGTAATTGYGAVGPRTRAKIASVCGGGTVSSNLLSASPTTGTSPFNVHFATQGATADAVYTLDFGDGSPYVQLYGSKQSADHAYTSNGTFTAKLQGSLPTPCNPDGSCLAIIGFKTVGAVTITVTGTSVTPNDKQSCENIGGKWGSVGDVSPNTPPYCNMPTNDAGKSCTDSSQCQSFCQAPTGTKRGTPATGACYGWEKKDCAFSVEDGMASEHIVCS